MFWLKIGLLASLIYAISFFGYYFYRFYRYYRPKTLAKPRGHPQKGQLYSLTIGLLPWEKESTRQHWLIYLVGVLYHLAIAGGFVHLFARLFGLAKLSNPIIIFFLFMGTGCGLSLFFRRWFNPALRQLSWPDDYLANLLVNLFLLTAALSVWRENNLKIFFLISLGLMVYLPLGKIRHCLFFIPSRLIFGRYYGLRGLMPPPGKKFFKNKRDRNFT